MSALWKENLPLGRWVASQREHPHWLTAVQRRRMDALGFVWRVREIMPPQDWETRFRELRAFHRRYGHCRVPFGWRENTALASWVRAQRMGRNKLTSSRRRRLDAAGFDWAPIRSFWEKQYAELQKFQAQHGHCRVPQRWPQNRTLARWVNRIRRERKKLHPDQRRRLDALGFDWNVYNFLWEKRFADLQEFQSGHGHCRIPYKWRKNPALYHWILHQRVQRRKGFLSPERKVRLDSIGFVWRPRANEM